MEVKRKYSFLSFIFIGLVAGQINEVQINVTSPVQIGADDLEITCYAEGSYFHIFSYTIHKNDTSGSTPVVRQYYVVDPPMVKTEWFLTDFKTRARLSGTPLPSPLATMKMTIPADRINMTADEADYQCDFVATQRSGNYPITHSKMVFINILPGTTGHSTHKSTTPTSTAGNRLSFGSVKCVAIIFIINFSAYVL